jgi:hypothetical protein
LGNIALIFSCHDLQVVDYESAVNGLQPKSVANDRVIIGLKPGINKSHLPTT